jgi:3'(2'), 5'-bisphosphate nucleotidase
VIHLELFEKKHLLAIEAAVEASRKIMAIYKQDFTLKLKADNSPVTKADIQSSNCILSYLEQTKIPIICEETTLIPYQDRKSFSEVWCVDPLDGTKEFIAKNNQFVVCIALITDNFPSFGVIASPTEEKIIFGGKTTGSFRISFSEWNNGLEAEKLQNIDSEQNIVKIATSRSHKNERTEKYIQKLLAYYPKHEIISKGSALKFMDMAEGNIHLYPRFSTTNEWDIAAGQAIVEGVGGTVINPETNLRLNYNKEKLGIPGFVAQTIQS